MPNGFESFASNALALGQRWREQRKERRIAEALSVIDEDPQAAIAGVTKADPITGFNMRRQLKADATAAEEAKRAKTKDVLTTVTTLLRPAAMDPAKTPESLGAAFDSVLPVLSDGLGMSPHELAQYKQMFVTNPGMLDEIDNKLRVVPQGAAVLRGDREVYRNPLAVKTLQVVRGDGGRDVINIDPNTGNIIPAGVGDAPMPQDANAGGGGMDGGGTTTPDMAWAFTRKAEGGYNPSDANGVPVNFGINQAANPDVDVKNLTEEQARQLFEERYFKPSGAGNLPPALGVLHSDTFYMNPSKAQEILQQSGGDPQRYLQLRQAWQEDLVRRNPKKFGRYAKSWENRNLDLASVIGSVGRAPPGQAMGGGPAVYSTPGKPAKEGGGGYTVLSPEEVAALGLPQHVRWQRSDKGKIEPIGGLAQLNPANVAKMEKKQQIYDSITANMSAMEKAAEALIRHPGLERAAGIRSYAPSLRGGAAANFEADLDALKSKIGFAILNDMRQMSPTGGALGNVSNFEVDTLQRNIAALDLTQSPAQLRARIKQISDYAKGLRERYSRAYNMDKSSLLGDQANTGQTGGRTIPREAVDLLRKNPSPARRQQFDQVFGQGAAKRVLGGK